MFGQIELEKFETAKLPQKGASYKPLLYVGKKLVRGTNHYFIAEQTLSTATSTRRIVKLKINEFNGVFEVVPNSIDEIIFD
ncbi:MAG: hypothetical protein IJ685_09445 [Selenomonadaceae bacterium]|nr:hypothetical protein [Selenomonadaceae bacterium]